MDIESTVILLAVLTVFLTAILSGYAIAYNEGEK